MMQTVAIAFLASLHISGAIHRDLNFGSVVMFPAHQLNEVRSLHFLCILLQVVALHLILLPANSSENRREIFSQESFEFIR